jgi:DNA repair exonuclease SbcCD nuclease subunit
MTKIAIINDTHFGIRGDSKIFLDHQERFFLEIFFPYLDEHGIKTVLDLGDTFDRRKYINYVTLKRAKDFFFDQMAKRGVEYHAVVGNHSVYYTNTNEINSMSLLLKEYSNFHFYEYEPKELTFGLTRVMMVPWITKDNADVCIETIRQSNAHILAGHFEIKGFEMMRGQVCDHGLDKDVFSNFEAVYSGHFHHPSEYGNIKYLGAPYEMTWSDYDGKRGFRVLDTNTRNLDWIENPYRVFYKVEYDDAGMAIDDIVNIDTSMMKDTYIKVIVKNRENAYLYDLFLTKLADSGAADVKTVEDSLNLESAGVEDILDETKDTKDILNGYIDSLETKIEKTKIKRVVNDLYIEAMSIA